MNNTTEAKWSWKNEDGLMDRLRNAQNTGKNIHTDIMTFVAFFTSRAELVAHVEYYEGRVA